MDLMPFSFPVGSTVTLNKEICSPEEIAYFQEVHLTTESVFMSDDYDLLVSLNFIDKDGNPETIAFPPHELIVHGITYREMT